VVATGTSQLDFLDALATSPDIDWQRVEMFHLDEYVGLPTQPIRRLS
jgi:glucosamine-6-phosphate deaminase